MHPPFFIVDHKIGPDIHHFSDHKPIIRRGTPTRLDLSAVTSGWPPVPLVAMAEDLPPVLPSGSRVIGFGQIYIVPPPQRTLRQIIGRFLIRAGQRMILENRA